jgi:hypothetical protein
MGFLGAFLIALGALLCALAFLAAFTPFALIGPLIGVGLVWLGARIWASRPLRPPPDADRLS